MDQADVVADRSARALEAGPGILACFTHRRRQYIGDGRLFARGPRLHADARHGGHGLDRLGEVAEIDLDLGRWWRIVTSRWKPPL